jgi:hypothetical protein
MSYSSVRAHHLKPVHTHYKESWKTRGIIPFLNQDKLQNSKNIKIKKFGVIPHMLLSQTVHTMVAGGNLYKRMVLVLP